LASTSLDVIERCQMFVFPRQFQEHPVTKVGWTCPLQSSPRRGDVPAFETSPALSRTQARFSTYATEEQWSRRQLRVNVLTDARSSVTKKPAASSAKTTSPAKHLRIVVMCGAARFVFAKDYNAWCSEAQLCRAACQVSIVKCSKLCGTLW